GENYGIPSGTYTPSVAVNGYYSPAPPEQVFVTLSGNPTSVSDHLFLGPGFNVSVYSIDWEQPMVSRDWVWSGCQSSFYPYGLQECVGSEIDVGWYPILNGTAGALADFFGPEASFQPLTLSYLPNDPHNLPPTPSASLSGGLYQGPGGTDCITGTRPAFTCAQMDGGGRNVLTGYDLTHGAYFGQSAEYAFVGGYTAGLLGLSTVSKLLTNAMFITPTLVSPLHFNQGQYDLAAYTYGYIQDKDFSAYAMNGQVADIKIDLIIGVNITLDILFKKESIITGTPYNMSARVRLFNDQGQLVATWMSSEGTYVDKSEHAVAANGELPLGCGANCNAFGLTDYPLYPFNSAYTVVGSGLNGYDYLPGGVTLVHVLMSGLPQQPPFWNLNTGTYFGDPIVTGLPVAVAIAPDADLDAPAFGSCDFQLNCYPAPYGQYPFPYTGIAGAPDYTGGWTAEADFVPWYANNTGTPQPVDPNQCQTTSNYLDFPAAACVNLGTYPQYYPPVDGLLMGESYHIIPGTAATSGISLTEDMALSSQFIGHSLVANHLGPYSQEGVWQIAGTHNSGEASGIFEVDLNGFLSGNVLAFTWSNEFRTLSWGTISVTGATGATLPFYTADGVYGMFLPTGNYKFSIVQPGYTPQNWSMSISPGETGTGQNVYLEQSNIPVPEFSGVAVVTFSALAASVYILKRKRK
ncbi:MAG TPA: hypothetical protein VEI80_03740, partial [Candidatus Acidoferrales bacterium]|nr:hypothetical protein [Candidatus Acidoferrales bacterium]